MDMRGLKNGIVVGVLCPAAAEACGGGGTDVAGLLLVTALFLLMIPAFLIPLAGLFVVRPHSKRSYARIFFGYAVVGMGAAASSILFDLNPDEASLMILLCAILLVTPSVHYLLGAARAGGGEKTE